MESPKVNKAAVMEYIENRISDNIKIMDAFNETAELFGFTSNQIRNVYYRNRRSIDANHGNSLLLKEQQILLLFLLTSFDIQQIPLTPQSVNLVVNDIFSVFSNRTWVYDFIKRHSDLLFLLKTKTLTKNRSEENFTEIFIKFCDNLELWQANYAYFAHNVLNFDETRVHVGKNNALRIKRKGKRRFDYESIGYKTICTLVSFVAAVGYVIFSVYIFPARKRTTEVLSEIDIEVFSEKESRRNP